MKTFFKKVQQTLFWGLFGKMGKKNFLLEKKGSVSLVIL